MDFISDLRHQLTDLERQDQLRRYRTIASAQGPVVTMDDGSEKVLFCSNNYLNLADDPRIKQAAAEALEKYGFGAAASRLISGTMAPHTELEQAFAAFLHKEDSLYFPSGWTANQALLTTLPKKGDLVLLDRYDHASIIDAVKASEAEFRTYRRNQPERLEKFLADGKYNNRFIVTESVFSMDGDVANLRELVELKNKYGAILIVDEAHSLGCFGPTGAGLCEQEGILDEVDIIVAPLGKAVAATGGIIAGPKTVINYLLNKARPFIYTTAPSPVIAAAALKSLEIIQSEPDRRKRLQDNAAFVRNVFVEMGLNIGNSTTQIIPVILGDSAKALEVSQKLYDAGYFISAIRPPTVPPGTARLRVSVQTNHTQEQLEGLCETLNMSY
ncbi:MAG: pyridoxal phosphate-dependent aminotransferase family protein [Phycisphaerae bacterium]|nr:pyridoxal phosphate-dependent aminotransferase family protein [Phycisphaerae bacterium]